MRALLHELKQNNTLEVVDLSWTGIRDENGGLGIGEYITGSAMLRWLNISHNDLGPASGVELARGIEANKCLTYLNVSYNGLGDKAVLEVTKAVGGSTTLEHIDLRCTGASEEVGREVDMMREKREEKMGNMVVLFSTSMIQASEKLEIDKWV